MIVVSVDTHVGPRSVEDLVPYCPADRIGDFDAYTDEASQLKATIAGVASYLFNHPNFSTTDDHDSAACSADFRQGASRVDDPSHTQAPNLDISP